MQTGQLLWRMGARLKGWIPRYGKKSRAAQSMYFGNRNPQSAGRRSQIAIRKSLTASDCWLLDADCWPPANRCWLLAAES